jgi:hypothetical protein
MSNNKDHIYGVLGSGDVNPKIVLDGLLDVNGENITFLIHARRKPQGAVTTVYDFLADNEAKFIAYHRIDDNAPKALLSLAQGVQVNDDPAKAIITSLKRSGGTLLLLWDEETPENSERLAIMAADAGVPMKDLSDGLAPIVVDGSDEPKVEEVEEDLPIAPKPVKEEKNLTAFTRDELMNMNIGVLRRQAKAIGIENLGRITKQEIVDAICSLSDDNREVDIDTDMAGEFIASADVHNPSDIGNGFFTWLEKGEVHTHPLPPIMVKWLIEELKTA